MSLVVYPYTRDPESGDIVDIDTWIDGDFSDLFGLESWRYSVWGSQVLLDLGCTILPSLRHTDIYAVGDQLDRLEAEIILIQKNLPNIIKNIKLDQQSISHRLDNAMDAIRIARQHEAGGVHIG